MLNFDLNMRNRLYIFIYLWTFVGTLLTAQPSIQFMAADGLSDNNALCGLRDQYGFVWIGTNNGLNRFDGTQNTVYRNMVEENSSYENNTITALYEHGQDIWFGGSSGLYVYHRNTNTFSRFTKKTKYGVCISAMVQNIVGGHDGKIWIGTQGQGLFIYDTASDSLAQDSRHGSFISDVLSVDDSPVFVASMQGDVYTFGTDGNMLKHFTIPDFVSDKNKICLAALDFTLYVGCERGLYRVHRGEQGMEQVAVGVGGIRSLLAKGDELLIGTDNGLYLYSPATEKVSLYSPATLKVNTMAWDRDSTLWVMTEIDGVVYMPMERKDVGVAFLPETGQSQMIRAVCEAPDGRIWIGADSGLFIYDPSTRNISTVWEKLEVSTLMLDGDNLWVGTRHDGIYVLSAKGEGGAHPAPVTPLRHYQYSNDRSYTIPSNDITSLLRTTKGDIFVGTSWGLCHYERNTENFMWFFNIGSQTHITSLAEDKQGHVWAATSNHGLFRRREQEGTFQNFIYDSQQPQSLSSNDVSTVFCDHRGDVWVTTTEGTLSRFLPEKEVFERIDTKIHYLQDQQIYFLVEDLKHNLWMGLENGMMRLGPDRTDEQTDLLQSGNSLAREPKPRNSAIITTRGELFAGRYNRLVSFHPDRINLDFDKTPVYITSLTFPFHQNGSKATPLTINSSDISLPYSDNSFTLHFAAPYFMSVGAEQSFEYMLQGVDRDWARGTKNAEATYANVQPGTYLFLLRKAGNNDSNTYAQLQITILPPWYRTNIAYIIYALLIVAVIALGVHRYSNRLRQRYSRRMEEYQAQQEKANFESKIRFFVNLVHEIRTPLTLMSLPLEAMSEELRVKSEELRVKNEELRVKNEELRVKSEELRVKNEEFATATAEAAEANSSFFTLHSSLKTHIAAIRRNMNYLLGITNQLLDFQKAEHGKMQLHISSCNVNQLLTSVCEQFADAIDVQGKRMQLQLSEQPVVTALDVDKVQKVMMNLVSNANKYARSEIIIRLETREAAETSDSGSPAAGGSQLVISVIDDGPGVPNEERDRIFDLYYQIGNDSVAATLGTGLGLSYAKMLAQAHHGDLVFSDSVGGGSNFQLVLPIRPVTAVEEQETASSPAVANIAAATADDTTAATSPTNHRILLVEDNEELLQMTTEALKQKFRILKARDGQEALDLLPYNDVDLIVSDVMMPRVDGIELCKRIKEDINYSHIPVILLTAKTSVEAKLQGMQSGADVYLEKPFSAKQLQLQIMSLLRMRQQFHERMKQIDGTQNDPAAATPSNLGLTQQDLLFMQRLQQMVAENMRDEEFSIDMLAEQMNMSRSSFYRKIKALTDLTPVEYLKTQRLEQAAALLKQGYRITEVAERVGFSSSSYFAKCFKARFGVLPKDFIANQ